jgi:hypothetical protein
MLSGVRISNSNLHSRPIESNTIYLSTGDQLTMMEQDKNMMKNNRKNKAK